jgi:anti-anti-sigma factor
MAWSRGSGLLVDVISAANHQTTVRLAGDFDIVQAPAARDVISHLVTPSLHITVDMSRVTFLDAAGARFLAQEQQRAQAAGGDLIVSHPSRPVRRVLELLSQQGPTVSVVDADPDATPAPGVAWACGQAVTELVAEGHADMATAQLAPRPDKPLKIIAQEGFRSRFLDFFEIVHDMESAGGMAHATGRPVWVPDVAESPIFAGTPALDVMLSAGSRSVGSVPVLAGDGSLIVISAHRRKPGDWTEIQRKSVLAVAEATGELLSR